MITVQQIELVNFRSIPYALIEPNLDGGMTALAGGNGLGKSSVVHGLTWALWGLTPADVSVKGLRRQGTEGAECRVTVTFEHDGQVVEVTRALKGKNDTTVAFIKVDGHEITNVSAKTAVHWLENRLGGLDAAGFLTAFVVRQKEMDDLVRARPAERKKLIERLAGIERMSEAVQRAREVENEAKKLVALLPGSEAALKEATTERDAADTKVATARDAESRAAETATTTEKAATAAEQSAAAAEAAVAEFGDLTGQKTAAEQRLAVAGTQLENAAAVLADRRAAAVGGDPDAVEQARNLASEARTAYETAVEQSRTALSARGQLEGLAKSANTARDALSAAAIKEAAARTTATDAKERALAASNPSDDELLRAANAVKAIESARGQLEGLAKSAQTAASALETASRNAENARRTVADSTVRRDNASAAPLETVAAAVAAVSSAQAARADAQAEYRRLSSAITTLSASTHPNCPTCNRDLENPETLIGALQVALEAVTGQGVQAKVNEAHAVEALAELQTQDAEAKEASSALNAAQIVLDDAEGVLLLRQAEVEEIEVDRTRLNGVLSGEEACSAALKSLQAQANEAQESARALTSALTAHTDAQAALNDRQSEFDDISGEIERLSDLLAESESVDPVTLKEMEQASHAARDSMLAANRAAEAAADLPEKEQHVAGIQAVIDDVTAEIQSLDAQVQGLAADPAQAAALAAEGRQKRSEASSAALAHQQAVSDTRVALEALSGFQRAVEEEQGRLDAKADAIKAHQSRTATREALEAFRMDRLARIAPELAEVTTDLVARMTNGRYIAVDMDENFTPILTDASGEQRPVSWLSGGEESVVALALRIGIGEVISGTKGGLLVLDEVLTAQDLDRRQAMMGAIRELPGRQVLMINHVVEALDIADKGYLFTTDDDGDVIVLDLAHEGATVHLEHALDSD